MNPSSEREAFEAWFEADSMPAESDWFRRETDDPDEYAYAPVHWAWKSWQARAALSTPHQAVQDLIKARDTFGWSPEVDEKINALRSLSTQPQQAGEQAKAVGSPSAMLDEAERLCKEKGYTSISYVQRKMKIGYMQATALVDELRAAGRVPKGPPC